MKLAISVEHFRSGVGGGENIALDVVRELRRRGHRVLVCAVSGFDETDFLKVAPADTASAARQWGAQLLIDWGIRVNADVHYLHGAPHKVFLRYAIYATPLWRRWLKRCEFALKGKHRRAIAEQTQFFQNPGASYLAVSNFVAKQVAEVTAPCKPDIRTLHNPVDTRRFSPAVREALHGPVRQRLRIADDAVVFVWVAHNTRLKNLDLLLRIFPEVHRQHPQAVLLVVGKRKPRLSAPWLVYAGALEQPQEAYAAADAMLHPTFYDTFANVVTEALACGIPVVCSDRAGAAEVLHGADCGPVLPVVGKGVERLWLTAVLQIASDRQRRQQQGQNGRKLALTMDFQHYADRLEAELRRFILNRGQAAKAG